MITEDQLAMKLDAGEVDVQGALDALANGEVLVWAQQGFDPDLATWADVEDMGAGSSLDSALIRAGADDAQLEQAGASIADLRSRGMVVDGLFGDDVWTGEGEPT